MIEAPIPPDEQKRLAALRKLNVLDTPIEERFERITRLTCRLLGVPIAAVSLVDEGRQWFKSIQGLDATESTRSVAFCAHTILEDETLIVPDVRADSRFADNPSVTGDPHIAFYAGHSLKASDGSRVGTLCIVDRQPRQLSAEDVQTLQDLAAMAETELKANALTKAQLDLVAQLDAERRRSMIDSLTRLWNRAGIAELMARSVDYAIRRSEPLGIIMGDIDRFKSVNDTHGHPTGDIVLQETAKRLLSALRKYDAVGRYGGEEFLVIAPNCDAAQVEMVASRMREKVAECPVQAAGQAIPVTISLGIVAGVPSKELRGSELIKAADDALYRAKRSGRDRVVMAA